MSPTTATPAPEQLDVFDMLDIRPDIDLQRGDNGSLCLTTHGKGWRARWTGSRWGWVFDRSTAPWGWETWEPDLPYGVDQVDTEADAREVLRWCVERHGDDPQWLIARSRNRRRVAA